MGPHRMHVVCTKNILLYQVVLVLMSQLAFGQGNIYDSLFYGGRWRTYMTHLPAGYAAMNPYPLVLAFHGGSPLGYQSIQFQSQLSVKADSAGFLVVYPEGVLLAGNRTWNAGGCCAPATSLGIDDIGFVNELLNKICAARVIDTTRVYATGFSNGALLCYPIANQLSRRFAAIAPVAGNLMYYPWNPSRAIPIIAFHSYKDLNIPYYGGVTIGPTGTYYPPQDSTLGIIGTQYLCQVRKQVLFHDSTKYDHFMYSNCAGNALIEQYVSYDGEHSWPGGLSIGGASVSQQFSATFLMWEFFKNYKTTDSKTGIVQDNQATSPFALFQNYPNPFNLNSNIKYQISEFTHVRLAVYDLLGREVAVLLNESRNAGVHSVTFDGSNVASGVYFYRMQAGSYVDSKKLVLLR